VSPRSEWWEDRRLADRIDAALHQFNEARERSENRALQACRDLTGGINLLYNAYQYQRTRLAGLLDADERHDAALLTQLLLAIPSQRKFTVDGPLVRLASLDPPIMDQSVLIRHLDNPWLEAPNIPEIVRHEACARHVEFKAQFERYAARGSGYSRLVRAIASTIAVFRNNLQHGEKAGARPRDLDVAETIRPVLEEAVELIFDYPSRKLATYGLLREDERFAEITGALPERRYDARILGTMERHGELKSFRSCSAGNATPTVVSVTEFPGTEAVYRKLDAFEGSKMYHRILLLAQTETRSVVCNVYEGIANRS